MDYYAHIFKNGYKEADYEHAINTMNFIEKFSDKICSQDILKFQALMHDAGGKHTKRFQNVLNGYENHINHAWSSAAIVLNEYRNIFANDESAMIAYNLIKGHHNGLTSNYLFDPMDTDEVFEEAEVAREDFEYETDGKKNAFSDEDEYKKAKEFITDLVNTYSNNARNFDLTPENGWENKEHKMLHIRLLMSCLVDADYSATAKADNTEYENYMDGSPLTPEKMLQKLEKYRDSLIKESDADLKINHLRNIVYHDAEETGKKSDPDFFQLTAPTGTAKTLALIKFALEQAKRNGQNRIVLVVPYLSITEQITSIYKKIFGDNVILEDDSNADLDEKSYIHAERWSAPIIITTNVKFYETLFSNKPSVLRKLHNITNAVIMFDESQSLDSSMADITINTLMQLPKYGSTVVLSTATPPLYHYRKNIPYKYKEIISDVKDLYREYKHIRENKVAYSAKEMSYKDISQLYCEEKQRLFILNTTKKALKVFAEIRKINSDDCFLLYSRMAKAHKKNIIKEIKYRLKKGHPCVVVSTQCIEAGVDLDFPVLCREWAPIPSLIQSFGRLNRNGKYKGLGYVFMTTEHNINRYPGTDYWNNTQATIKIAEKHGMKPDINSLKIQDAYFKSVFSISGTQPKDKRELIEGLKACDFEQIKNAYKVIDDAANISIIVPYSKEMKLYKEIQEMLADDGMVLTKKIMKKAGPITVNIFGTSKESKEISNGCEEIYLRINGTLIPSGWMIMSNASGFYNDTTGLDTEEQSGGIIL